MEHTTIGRTFDSIDALNPAVSRQWFSDSASWMRPDRLNGGWTDGTCADGYIRRNVEPVIVRHATRTEDTGPGVVVDRHVVGRTIGGAGTWKCLAEETRPGWGALSSAGTIRSTETEGWIRPARVGDRRVFVRPATDSRGYAPHSISNSACSLSGRSTFSRQDSTLEKRLIRRGPIFDDGVVHHIPATAVSRTLPAHHLHLAPGSDAATPVPSATTALRLGGRSADAGITYAPGAHSASVEHIPRTRTLGYVAPLEVRGNVTVVHAPSLAGSVSVDRGCFAGTTGVATSSAYYPPTSASRMTPCPVPGSPLMQWNSMMLRDRAADVDAARARASVRCPPGVALARHARAPLPPTNTYYINGDASYGGAFRSRSGAAPRAAPTVARAAGHAWDGSTLRLAVAVRGGHSRARVYADGGVTTIALSDLASAEDRAPAATGEYEPAEGAGGDDSEFMEEGGEDGYDGEGAYVGDDGNEEVQSGYKHFLRCVDPACADAEFECGHVGAYNGTCVYHDEAVNETSVAESAEGE